ncbi:hypothetical protein H696_01642 [Fonticula alba]|uniref:Ubiquitin-like domain-containing protein n=1 Tax=Fonticula alba TaxID=691883 RepID=A0A058ZFI8_FONAL|nr:hypothetical protein H696_01642 [Fonticula alba]KCV72242.1 hypothetical protein H696_01642 [Fonticula alba]|eukprot:XP_009493820.1 hypothetical protein H696_01642 [Fonticula alba]
MAGPDVIDLVDSSSDEEGDRRQVATARLRRPGSRHASAAAAAPMPAGAEAAPPAISSTRSRRRRSPSPSDEYHPSNYSSHRYAGRQPTLQESVAKLRATSERYLGSSGGDSGASSSVFSSTGTETMRLRGRRLIINIAPAPLAPLLEPFRGKVPPAPTLPVRTVDGSTVEPLSLPFAAYGRACGQTPLGLSADLDLSLLPQRVTDPGSPDGPGPKLDRSAIGGLYFFWRGRRLNPSMYPFMIGMIPDPSQPGLPSPVELLVAPYPYWPTAEALRGQQSDLPAIVQLTNPSSAEGKSAFEAPDGQTSPDTKHGASPGPRGPLPEPPAVPETGMFSLAWAESIVNLLTSDEEADAADSQSPLALEPMGGDLSPKPGGMAPGSASSPSSAGQAADHSATGPSPLLDDLLSLTAFAEEETVLLRFNSATRASITKRVSRNATVADLISQLLEVDFPHAQGISLRFDGEVLSPEETPASLDIEDEDIVDVVLTGGGGGGDGGV